jgi:hypothetical protein
MKSKLYMIFPDGCKTISVKAASHEMAYCAICCWYAAEKKVAVLDMEKGTAKVYSRELDKAGNLIRIVEHDKVW